MGRAPPNFFPAPTLFAAVKAGQAGYSRSMVQEGKEGLAFLGVEPLSVEQAVQELSSALGPKLKAIYRFGTDFALGPRAGRGRLLVLVDRLDVTTLELLVELVTRCQASAIKVRVDTEENLLGGADAFPAFTLELRDHRELLWGDDLLAKLTLHEQHLRLHVEHGLRSMLRELSDYYLDRDIKGYQLPALRRLLRKLVYLLEGALICQGALPGGPAPAAQQLTPEAILQRTQEDLLPSANPLVWQTLQRFARDDLPLQGDGAARLYACLFEALHGVIAVIDQLSDG